MVRTDSTDPDAPLVEIAGNSHARSLIARNLPVKEEYDVSASDHPGMSLVSAQFDGSNWIT